MKAKIQKFIMPILIATMAIAGAFANNLSRQEESALIDRIGFIKVGIQCTSTSVICTTIFNPLVCTNGVDPLYDWNGSGCPNILYHKIF